MNKITISRILIIIGIVALVATIVGFATKSEEPTEELNVGMSLSGTPLNVVGSRVGTTTTTVVFPSSGSSVSTTTYKTFIGKEIDKAIYQIRVVNASTSAEALFSVLGSYDAQCDTATTTTTMTDIVLASEINWFDVGDHIRNAATMTSLTTATTTIAYSDITGGANREIMLDDLNHRCLALQVHASTTEMVVQLLTK